MVANAGIAVVKPFLESDAFSMHLWPFELIVQVSKATMKDYDNLMAVNARGVWNCYQAAAVQMIAQGRGGKIIGARFVFPIDQNLVHHDAHLNQVP